MPVQFLKTKKLYPCDDTRNCMVCDTKSDRHPCFVLRQSQSMARRNWSIRREEPSIAITANLRPFVTHTGLTVKTALFLFVIVTHSSSMKGLRLNFHAERELAGHRRPPFFSSFLQLQGGCSIGFIATPRTVGRRPNHVDCPAFQSFVKREFVLLTIPLVATRYCLNIEPTVFSRFKTTYFPSFLQLPYPQPESTRATRNTYLTHPCIIPL